MLECFGARHAGILTAVGFACRDPHAEHLHPAGQPPLQALLIQDQSGEYHSGWIFTGKVPEKGIRIGHLRNFGGVDERAELDDIDARRAKAFDPADLFLQWNGRLLDLQTVARPDFVDKDFIR